LKYKKFLSFITDGQITSLKQFYASTDIDLINKIANEVSIQPNWKGAFSTDDQFWIIGNKHLLGHRLCPKHIVEFYAQSPLWWQRVTALLRQPQRDIASLERAFFDKEYRVRKIAYNIVFIQGPSYKFEQAIQDNLVEEGYNIYQEKLTLIKENTVFAALDPYLIVREQAQKLLKG
jgi:hypothetical protein